MSESWLDEPARRTAVLGEYEVVVVGGGPAGVMAAAAAARAGRSTILVERYGYAGGAGSAGGLSTFCGLHANVHGEHRQVVHGLADELLQRIDALGGLNPPHLSFANRILAQAYDISAYKIALDELLVGSGVQILFHATAVGVRMHDERRVDALMVESKSGRGAIRGQLFVDASGDGDLAAWAGAPYEKTDPAHGMLYPSLMFRVNGVDAEAARATYDRLPALMEEAERSGRYRFPRKRPIVRPQRNPLEWRANITQLANPDGSAIDGTDVWQLTRGELQGRRQVRDVFPFFQEDVPGFAASYVVDIAPSIGIRETRRIVGPYQLSEDDILDCADFPDAIGVNGWPVEAHVAGDVEIRWQRGENPRGYNQLPFRMIVPQVLTNTYVAGRCASMTHEGQSSARVTGPCFAMGQAAGVAADLALGAGVAVGDVDVTELQRRLEKDGVWLGGEGAR
ncbi:FAD-dependent oxidoreductase [Geodermatophilus ruber]|uniref:FAD dependent oxidoreductase n=1 Tax=Geodermatophilus ruber TaxID=504800 RepID=A0A1I4HQT1_9ACTN|nr:FAD-dependent oxidoreductase [Geodermatophilus ruber]SFL44515.1 FAD dependent oxidoreductase [Geodermatophilus ruber]